MRTLALALLLACPCFAAAKKKTKVTRPAAAEAALTKALDEAQPKVAQCVLDAMPPGKWTVTVKADVTLNSAAQLMGLKLDVAPPSPPIAQCIDKVVRAVAFPKSEAPLVKVQREWTFASQ